MILILKKKEETKELCKCSAHVNVSVPASAKILIPGSVRLVPVSVNNMRNDFKAVASDFIEVDPYHYPNKLVVSGMVSAVDFSAVVVVLVFDLCRHTIKNQEIL